MALRGPSGGVAFLSMSELSALEMIVDSFAGGGGASIGIEWGVGRGADAAINHDQAAITMHEANHPRTKHYTEDVWKVAPQRVTGGRPVGLLWASPDCKHFSRAKGAKPVEKRIRSLAWVIVKWAVEGKPRVIILENVREFEEWGPLLPRWTCQVCEWRGTEGQAVLVRRRRMCPRCDSRRLVEEPDKLIPDPARKGLTFRRFVGRLRAAGYEVQHRVLNAANYGAPTHRRRLFLVARCDGQPIVWPEATHGDPRKAQPELFNILKPWRTAAEIIDWSIECPSIFDRKRPLVENTMRRIAHGMKRYVLDNPRPFIVRVNHGGDHFRGQPLDQPMATVTASRGDALLMPYLTRLGHTGAHGKQCSGAGEPLTTIVSKNEHLLIAPVLDRQFGRSLCAGANEPCPTVMPGGGGKTALVAAFLAKHFGGVVGVPIDTPLPTTTMRGTQNQVVAAHMVHFNHGDKQWSGCDEPLRAITTGRHAALVYGFLTKYFGTAIGQPVDYPLHTITEKARFGLVMVTLFGEPWLVVDIGMRMLTARELARAQGFPESYILTGTETDQIARIGNSVPPVMAKVLSEAQFMRPRISLAA